MIEDHDLRAVLREWEAPEPSPEIDGRVLAGWRGARPRVWRRIWTARVSVPIPVLAALLAIAAFRLVKAGAVRPAAAPLESGSYVTRLNGTGFQPVPNGDARVITVKEAQ